MTSQQQAAAKRARDNNASHAGEADTFTKLLLENLRERGERPAIRQKTRGIWRTTSWRDLTEETAALAAALSAHGLKRGEHVVLLGDNRPRLYSAIAAAHAIGAVAVPLFQDASPDELVPMIRTVEATHVFAENQEQVDKLLGVLPKMPSVRSVIYDADRGMRHYRQPELASYASLIEKGREIIASKPGFLETEAERGSGDGPAFVFFTSGTTGPAKAAVLTHGALIERARAVARIEGLRDADSALAYLPPGWMAQAQFSYVLPMTTGYSVCCPESSETMISDMREIGPSIFLASPRVLDTLLTQITSRIEDAGPLGRWLYRTFMRASERSVRRELGGKGGAGGLLRWLGNPLIYAPIRDIFGLSRVRVAYTTGDVSDPDLIVFFRALGINLKQLYGPTEAAFLVAMHRDGNVRLDTVGTAIDGVEIKVGDGHEILVRSNGLFTEYTGDAKATAKVRSEDGWLRTGDAGYLADDGHIRIVDNVASIGKLKGGALFTPRAIESKLKFFPYIKEAVIFGEGRDSVSALIDIDTTSVSRWADKRSISYTGNADLASRDEVVDLVASCVEQLNRELAGDAELAASQISRFIVLPKEMGPDDGVLTRTGKPQRAMIANKYKSLIDAMYAGKSSVPFDIDGPGPNDDQLAIREAALSAPVKPRRVA